MLYFLYFLILSLFGVYSYVLVDPNITFIQHPLWISVREIAVNVGYHNRPFSWNLYLTGIILLFVSHLFIVRYYKRANLKIISIIVAVALVFSYPFLSHDFFNYLFDAKIFTVYGKNPYLFRALDFPQDEWLRFMHWVHRTYPYGPTFLPITFIPSFLSFGKFLLNFVFFKLFYVGFYFLGVYSLSKISKRSALFFATHPLVLIEGLVNAHNDLWGVSFALWGVSLLFAGSFWWGKFVLLLSGGIKYITASLVFFSPDKKSLLNGVAAVGVVVLLLYLTTTSEIQPWYFLALFALLPYYKRIVFSLQPFFMGLLLAYYPFIRLGGWGENSSFITLKHQIIWSAALVNIVVLLFYYLFAKKSIIQSCLGFSAKRKHHSKK